uniref:Chromatin-remodeling ATPase INO80 n=1 Tax=Macaca fascicularis TaxID=9541 RepID=A0A2K5VMT9_MACFA
MASELGARDDGGCTELAKPLYLQYLERALRLDHFLRQTSAIFNRNISSDDSEDGLDDSNPLLPQSGDPLIQVKEEPPNSLLGETSGAGSSGMLNTYSLNGVLQSESKCDKGNLYNFSKLKKSRKWLKSILLSDESSEADSQSEDDDEEELNLSREELHNMLRLHKYKKLHQNKYSKDKELQQYQYYSAGLLSTYDPFYEQQRHLLGPKKKKFKEEKKLKAKLKKVKKKRRRDEELSSEESPRRHHHQTKVFAKFSHDAPPPGTKKKHLSIEQLNARRRKVWLSIVKKELPKANKQKASARNLFLTNSRKLAHQCMKEVRRAALQAQKNCKETLPRARRLTKEMLLYWKKYEKVEKEHRKRAEKEALEQRKLDEEMREAKRQQRKLNFLITQTELYAHFMSRKRDMGHDGIQEEILRKLEDSSTQRQIDIGGGVVVNITQEDYDSNHFKAQALKNAENAYHIHQARTRSFDEDAKESRAAALRAANKSGTGFGESYSLANPSIRAGEDIPQPTIFNGKLKGYQLKGMNWLANLYEQGINGILADEMGLGKTVQSIALLAHLAERENIWGPFLIISPASTLNNWHQEFTRFVPKFKVLPYWGNPHDRKVIRRFWSQLWALLHFIMPTLFDSHEEFNEWFSKDIESHAENKSAIDENQLSRLHMILKPFMLRRIKKDVENELSDKIEILMYCQLTSRQKLLYQALKNKISIEDLLQSSMGSTQQAQNTTSSLMNLVMQFRKVCNHPELFERQETWSPFHISLKPYHISKFIYRHGQIRVFNHSRDRWLRVLSPFAPDYIQQSLFHRKGINEESCFSFLRFIDISPAEMANLMLQGLLARWLALFLSLKASYRLYQLRSWGEPEGESHQRYLRNKDFLLGVNFPLSFPNLCSCPLLKSLVFSSHCKAVSGYSDQVVHQRRSATSSLRRCLLTELPSFLCVASPRVTAVPLDSYCNDRSAEYERRVLKEGGSLAAKQCLLNGAPELAADWLNRRSQFFPEPAGGLWSIRPQNGWSFIRIPGKESLITDSGKLYALDVLLTRLKSQGHRVLIYSQMTRMIDLLEEYMVYRKHTYMRLDGSSKISERRDMVADFQNRNDIFVFLLSTRAGGLGINLTAADTVIFYDSDWNPTVDQQAMDRAHRLGQTKQVTVYRLICKGTIEERILQRAKEKSEIQRMVISGGNFKPDTLKPKEVVSLLLDDEELEKKLRLRQEEKRQQEETNRVKERKRKREKYAEKISISSELHTGSIPLDESSSDMLVIVDDPASSAPQSRATNSPASITGSVSDTVNGISIQEMPAAGRGHSARSRGRPKGSGSTAKGAGKGRSRKSTAGSAAAMAGAKAGAAAASAAAYAAYGYNVSKGISASSPLQTSLVRPAGLADFGPSSASSPLSSPLSKGNNVPGTPKNFHMTSSLAPDSLVRKQGKGTNPSGGR